MAKYEVVRPWFGVAVGDVIETDRLHPAIASNVRVVAEPAKLDPATPKQKFKAAKAD